jgi:hypothetical protein
MDILELARQQRAALVREMMKLEQFIRMAEQLAGRAETMAARPDSVESR